MLGSEYTLPEKMNVLRGLIDVFSVMYPHWQTIDFRHTAEQLKVPVYIFTGKHELDRTNSDVRRPDLANQVTENTR